MQYLQMFTVLVPWPLQSIGRNIHRLSVGCAIQPPGEQGFLSRLRDPEVEVMLMLLIEGPGARLFIEVKVVLVLLVEVEVKSLLLSVAYCMCDNFSFNQLCCR